MMDTQMKEHAYTASRAAAEKSRADVTDRDNALEAAKRTYKDAVIQAAIASELLRRRKDRMLLLCYVGVFAVLALIGVIIAGPLLGVGVLLAGVMIRLIAYNSKAEAITIDLKARKAFFSKYGVNLNVRW